MALVMMAMVFMLTEKIKHQDVYPFLTFADIEDLLAHFLSRRDTTKLIRGKSSKNSGKIVNKIFINTIP